MSCKSLKVVSDFYLHFEAFGTAVPLVQNGVSRLSGIALYGLAQDQEATEMNVATSSYLVGWKPAGKL